MPELCKNTTPMYLHPAGVWGDSWTHRTVQNTNRIPMFATVRRFSWSRLLHTPPCESGGTGRRARLRISWVTVGVQVPPLAPGTPLIRQWPSSPRNASYRERGCASAMKMEMTELGPMKRALKIEVPAEEVTQRFTRAYGELNRQVTIPGFRPGKAPGPAGNTLCQNRGRRCHPSLVPDFYDKAIRQAGIVPVHVEIPRWTESDQEERALHVHRHRRDQAEHRAAGL